MTMPSADMQVATAPWVCPEDRQPLQEQGGSLRCSAEASHEFAVVSGIPRFVRSSAYADHFGIQWKRYRQTQLDSFSKATISRDRLRRCLGEEVWSQLPKLRVLEAGCGAGRFTEVLLAEGATVVSIDLSDAIEANAENFPASPKHFLAQADITQPPLPPESFDVVLCLGVVQHTPDSAATVRALWNQVKPGGWLVFDHYRHQLSWYTKTAPLVRQVLIRMDRDKALKATEAMVRTMYPLHRALRKAEPLRKILTRISPVQTYHNFLPQLSEEGQYELAMLDTHDSLTAGICTFMSLGGVKKIVEALPGMERYTAEKGGNGIEARARKSP